MSELSRRWYVVHTQPHAEKKALVNLLRQGFEAYLPKYTKRCRHARRITNVIAPLFPRYLFVAIDLSVERWRAVHSTFGVAHMVCNGDAPMAVPTGVVEEIREREDENGLIDLRPLKTMRRGEPVRVTDGPFFDQLGLFDEINADHRVAVLLSVLGRTVRVLLPEGFVSATA